MTRSKSFFLLIPDGRMVKADSAEIEVMVPLWTSKDSSRTKGNGDLNDIVKYFA